MKELISSFFTLIIYVASFLSYGFGLVHSFKKHGIADGIIGVVAFPWAMYRGAEFLWHDDYENVNWEKRLSNDMYTCAYIISSINESNSERIKINEEIEKFSNKISSYPEDKRKFIISGTRKLIQYSNSLGKDFLSSLNICKINGNLTLETCSTTHILEGELILTYYLGDEVENSSKEMNNIIKKLKVDLFNNNSFVDQSKLNNLIQETNLQLERHKKESNRLFKLIFNEPL